MSLTVGMLLFESMTQLDLTGPYEVFSRMPDTKVLLLAPRVDWIKSEYGLRIMPDCALDDAPALDVLFVPGGSGVSGVIENANTLRFLRERAASARYVTSVCTGALALGAAGLLRGYRATTHWMSLDLLPLVGAIPVAQRIVIDRNRITSGGVTAGIDFGLAIAAEIFGKKAAEKIQLMMEYAPQPPFNSGSPATADSDVVESIRNHPRIIEIHEQREALLKKIMA